MRANDMVLVRGMRDTRATLRGWGRDPAPVLGRWFAGSLAIASGLLLAVWIVALLSPPDPTRLGVVGLYSPATMDDFLEVMRRNFLVLALHAMACVAGFIAGSSLPMEAERYTGVWRWVHDRAGPLAIAFVIGATTFSLVTQAYVLGGGASTISAQLGISPGLLILSLLPHALIELVALFLPLAAWIMASRHGDWHQLLAATFVTVAIALPMLAVSAVLEITLWPDVLRGLTA